MAFAPAAAAPMRRAPSCISSSVRSGRSGTEPPTLAPRDPAGGADARRVRGSVAVRPTGAVPGRAQVHEIGIERAERVGPDAVALGRAGAEPLHHDVDARHQRVDDREALRRR